MEDRPNSRNSVLEEVMDEEPQGDYITLEQLAEIDTTKYPDDLTSPMWLYDAWEIGRQFSAFRIELNQALFHGDEVVEDNDRYSISRILSNMLTMEVYLARHGFVPSILTQIKQHRQRLAEIYLRMDEKLPDNDGESNEEDTDGDISDEEDLPVGSTPIKLEHIYPLEDKSTDWLYIISEEMRSVPTFPVVDDLRVDLISVIEEPQEFYREDVWDWMDQQPREDFVESCTCLATNNPTASMMLSLRAVEYCLREWYEYDTGRDIEERTWGQVISELEDHYDSLDHRPSVLSNLDYLKTKRNEVSHPDESPDTREAERMLYRIEGTITDIYNHISID